MDYNSFQMRRAAGSVLPPDNEIPTQMSPFGDERWDLDAEENKRRRQTHRQYVFSHPKPVQFQPQFEEPIVNKIEEPKPLSPDSPQQIIEEPTENLEGPAFQTHCSAIKKDFFKTEPPLLKPKPLGELQFDVPKPPDLFPVLKFPARKIDPNSVYKIPNKTNFVPFVSGMPAPPAEEAQLPSKTQFTVFEDVKSDKSRILHYGVHVPFWEFS